MSHFAKVGNFVGDKGVVEGVIVAEQDFIDSQQGKWIQTSYNMRGGVHLTGGTPLRKNYAGIGFIYDIGRDAFYEPQPFPSWILNEETCLWSAPVEYPNDGKRYLWDEASLNWIILT